MVTLAQNNEADHDDPVIIILQVALAWRFMAQAFPHYHEAV